MDAQVDLVLGCYAAFALGDIDGAVAPLAPDIVWIEPDEFPNGGERHGRAAVHDYLSRSYASWAHLTSIATARRNGDDIVVVHQVGGALPDGEYQTARVADVFTFLDGAIVRMQAYADPSRVIDLPVQ